MTEPLRPPELEDPKRVYVPVAGAGIATAVCLYLILPRGLFPALLALAVTAILLGVGTLVFRRYLGNQVELTPDAVILKGPGGTRRIPVEDILDVEERESGVVVLTKDLERVPMPFDSDRLRHGLRILLAHKKGSPGDAVVEAVRELGELPILEVVGGTVFARWRWLRVPLYSPGDPRLEEFHDRVLEAWMECKGLGKKPPSPEMVAVTAILPTVTPILAMRKGAKTSPSGRDYLGKLIHWILVKVAKALKVSLWAAATIAAAIYFGPGATVSAVYWAIARRVDSVPVPKSRIKHATLTFLEYNALLTGLLAPVIGILYLPLPRVHCPRLAIALALGAVATMAPSVRAVSHYRRDPVGYTAALLNDGILVPEVVLIGAGTSVLLLVLVGAVPAALTIVATFLFHAVIVLRRIERAAELSRRAWKLRVSRDGTGGNIPHTGGS
ncbi:PH domain-containing protein [Methanopyrus kandleri]|uniref:Fusion of at least two uncharacterized domain specific for M.kandleri, MK-12 family n=1 Tax=Methanopyrus kandleri (strain AV19 / DSM 6324 / JCM 9639 / NBRC 100938) TaxID=190192 RepID=Q8TW66_METKA|nr:PH domain-containing protein [Methanopyrus kandleri]AAM02383.1 Fusion of at least two uncharacterized domain specific for M.kandleri, MK-12 family [Methanopyrus kandleri AV19]